MSLISARRCGMSYRMVSLTRKMIKGHPYYYLRECQRVHGKSRIVRQRYVGSGETVSEVLSDWLDAGRGGAAPSGGGSTESAVIRGVRERCHALPFLPCWMSGAGGCALVPRRGLSGPEESPSYRGRLECPDGRSGWGSKSLAKGGAPLLADASPHRLDRACGFAGRAEAAALESRRTRPSWMI